MQAGMHAEREAAMGAVMGTGERGHEPVFLDAILLRRPLGVNTRHPGNFRAQL